MDKPLICSNCDKPLEPGSYWMCGEDDGQWCEDCWEKTTCSQGVHGEGCPTHVFSDGNHHPKEPGIMADGIPAARALAHDAIGYECKMYSGAHDEICDRITSALYAAQAEVERLNKLVYVPGMWKCAKCKFVGMHMTISAATGDVGVKADDHSEKCPNDCGPLWPVTERDAGNELADRAADMSDELRKLRAQLATAREALKDVSQGFFGCEDGEIGCHPEIIVKEFQRRLRRAAAAYKEMENG